MAKDTDCLILELKNQDEIDVTIVNRRKTIISCFKLKLINIDAEHFAIPQFKQICFTTLNGQELQHIFKTLKEITNVVIIKAWPNKIQFSASFDIIKGSYCFN